MSHFTRVKTQLRDATLLAKALEAVGYRQTEVHDEAQTLHGVEGDARPEKAEVVIRRRHISGASNDLGFARQSDGTFEAIISSYDQARHDDRWLGKVAQAYGHAATLQYADLNGFDIATDEVERDGTRRVTLVRTR